jgi:predicted transglutaminase-like cysteine proteinase
MPSTRIDPETFFAKGLETSRNINCHEAVLGHRAISPRHVGLIACFILVLIAAFGKPASPSANGGSHTGANIATPEHSVVRTNKSVAFAALTEFEIPSATRSEPFGLHSVEVTSGWLLNTWRGVQNDIRVESEILMRCRVQSKDCSPAAKTFLAIITEGGAHTGRARIGIINRAINLAIRAKRDHANWMGPLATLTKGSGDCKDYAIAKYVALREAGVAEKDLRIVIVHDLAFDEDHAIVTTRLGRNWIVLDNRWLALAQDADLRRVVPLFILGRDGLRQFIPEKTDISWYDIRFSPA